MKQQRRNLQKKLDTPVSTILLGLIGVVACVALVYALVTGSVTPSYIAERIDGPERTTIKSDLSGTSTEKLLTGATSTYMSVKYNVPAESEEATDLFTSNANAWMSENNIKDITSPKQAEEIGITSDGCDAYVYDADYTKHTGLSYVSYVGEVYSFTCGAHGSTYNVIYNEDIATHKQIGALTDIYRDDIYAHVASLASSRLPAQLKSEKGVDVKDISDMFYTGIQGNKDNYSTFYFDNADLVVVFGQYAIGPYAMGITEFRVPLSSLASYKR